MPTVTKKSCGPDEKIGPIDGLLALICIDWIAVIGWIRAHPTISFLLDNKDGPLDDQCFDDDQALIGFVATLTTLIGVLDGLARLPRNQIFEELMLVIC